MSWPLLVQQYESQTLPRAPQNGHKPYSFPAGLAQSVLIIYIDIRPSRITKYHRYWIPAASARPERQKHIDNHSTRNRAILHNDFNLTYTSQKANAEKPPTILLACNDFYISWGLFGATVFLFNLTSTLHSLTMKFENITVHDDAKIDEQSYECLRLPII